MNNLAIYDRDLAVERAGGSPELASDLFGMLINELPTHRASLLGALANNDFTSLQRQAHKLHGSAIYTGVAALRHAVSSLESHLKQDRTQEVSRGVDEVIQEIDRVIAYATQGGRPQ